MAPFAKKMAMLASGLSAVLSTAIGTGTGLCRTFTPTNYSSPYITRVIPKLTARYTQDSLGGTVFATMGPSVTYTLQYCGKYVRFTVDPYRNRVVFARNEWRSGSFGSRGSGAGQYDNPRDIDIYYIGTLVVADAGNNRLVFLDWMNNVVYVEGSQVPCSLNPDDPAITPIFRGSIGPADGFQFSHPMGVSVDDRGTPTDVGDDLVWVADTGNNRIVQVRADIINGGQQLLGTYGSPGGGIGQFNLPLRVIRGRLSVNGDSATSRNNSELFVLDHGNNRVVKLHCDSLGLVSGATWVSSVTVMGDPSLESIATDAWGNLYVTDSRNHRVLKYSPDLELLEAYGVFGKGVMNGEMCQPVDFRPQFRRDYATTPPQYVATPFALLSEAWGDSTGGQGYFLGASVADLATNLGPSPGTSTFTFKLTDHASTRIEVLDGSGQVVRVLDPGTIFRKSGTNSVVWDGRGDDGSLAQQCRTYRFRITPRTGYSASFDSTEIKITDFDFSPRTPFTYRVTSNTTGATVIDNGSRIVLPSAGYALACTTCTTSASRTLSTDPMQYLGGNRYCFDGWSDGGRRTHSVALARDSTITLNLTVGHPPTPISTGAVWDELLPCNSPYLVQGSTSLRTSSASDTFRIYPGVHVRFPVAGGNVPRFSLSIPYPVVADSAFFETVDSMSTYVTQRWEGIQAFNAGSMVLKRCSIRNANIAISTTAPIALLDVEDSGFEANEKDIVAWIDPARSGTTRLLRNQFLAKQAVAVAAANTPANPSVSATITGNFFRTPTKDIDKNSLDVRGGFQGSVDGNTFTANQPSSHAMILNEYWDQYGSGAHFYPTVSLRNNRFVTAPGNSRIALTAPPAPLGASIIALYNDWGAYDVTGIGDLIVDKNESGSYRAEVFFNPWTYTSGGGGGGCPFVLSETDSGFVIENTLLGNSELATSPDGLVSDSYELHRARPDTHGIVRLRIAELETETDEIDRVALGSVVLEEGEEIGTAPDGGPVVYRAVDHTLTRTSWTGSRSPFISPIAPTDAYRGEPGDSLELQVAGPVNAIPGGSWRRGIGISLIPKPKAPPSPIRGPVGIALRVSPDASGERWFTAAPFIPRENWSTVVVPLDFMEGNSVQRMRLIWNSAHTLGWVGEVEMKSLPNPLMLPCVGARHSSGRAVTVHLAEEDAQQILLKPGEHVDLEFDAKDTPPGGRFVLFAHGRYTHAGTPETGLIPKVYSISQNRPNPFNPETAIELRLPLESHVSVRIFDVSGRLVRALVDGSMPAGIHTVRWNGRDQEGRPQASGVYFYEVKVDQFSRRLRMVLLR